jgi:hypothetical protein
MKTFMTCPSGSIHPQKNNPDIIPQAIPPDCNPAPKEPEPQKEKIIAPLSTPEIGPEPNHPLTRPAKT